MTTKIYFNATWVFKDGRNSFSSDFCVDIYQDVIESIPNTDLQEHQHISKQFSLYFFRAFPQFNNTEYKMTALGKNAINFLNHFMQILSSSLNFRYVR